MSRTTLVPIRPEDVTPVVRIGDYGLYRTSSGEYVREFSEGLCTVPFYNTCLTVVDYPLRTELHVSYIADAQVHIGPAGEYIDVRLETRKHRIRKPGAPEFPEAPSDFAVACHVKLMDDFRLYGTGEERERTDYFFRQALKTFQKSEPDHGAVRGVTAHAPIRCLSYNFCQHSQKYFCDFGVKFHADLATLVVPCVFQWIPSPLGRGSWDCDLAPRIGDTPEERRPTEERLLAALFERLEEDALREDENRDADEWQRIQDYRQEVRKATGQKITPAEARRALGLYIAGPNHQEDLSE